MPTILKHSEPRGVAKPFHGTVLPQNHLWADGSLLNISQFPALYAEIGTNFNTGGETPGVTFRIPNYNGRSPMGAGFYSDPVSGGVTRLMTPGNIYLGAEKHQLSTAELANHGHGDANHSHGLTFNSVFWRGYAGNGGSTIISSGAPGQTHEVNAGGLSGSANSTGALLSNAGSNNTHNNTHPTVVCNFIIRY